MSELEHVAEKKGKVMVIDDDVGMMDAMSVVLKKYDIQVTPFTEAITALENLKKNNYHILIINYLMNPVRGDEIVKLVREFNKDIYIILMSAHKELTPSIDTMRSLDIQAYYEKSSRFDQLVLLVESGFKYVASLDNVKKMSRTIELHAIEVADILRNTVGAKDNFTKDHSDRVAKYANIFGNYLNLNKNDLDTLILAAQFHDVGKIGISDTILLKSAKLTEDEYNHMKLHPLIGTNILSSCKIFEDALPLIKYHHEQYDGLGYPSKLKGEEIPYLARVLTLCDAFDAITAKRPYKDATTIEYGLEEISNGAGKQFDPELSKKFIQCIKETYEKAKEIQASSF